MTPRRPRTKRWRLKEMSRKSDMRYKSAREIEKMLQEWALQGRITSKTLMGRKYSAINRKYASGELLVTSVEGVDLLNNEDRQVFETLRESKRLLTKREVMLYKHLSTEYQIKQAVKKGELVKFDLLGRSAILYIE